MSVAATASDDDVLMDEVWRDEASRDDVLRDDDSTVAAPSAGEPGVDDADAEDASANSPRGSTGAQLPSRRAFGGTQRGVAITRAPMTKVRRQSPTERASTA